MTVQSLQYFPSGVFRDKDGDVPTSTFANSYAAGTANTVMVAGVTGKRHRITSMVIGSSEATVSEVRIDDAVTDKMYINAPANTERSLPFDFNPDGWIETATGNGLRINVATAAVRLSFRYITYTP